MSRRALLVGSQTGSLVGVNGDVEVMAEALKGHDFDVEMITERKATRAGIAGAYQDLVAVTTPGDAVVVYYSGHGGRSANAMRTREPSQPDWLQYIVPTDIDDRSGGEFRGILAEELSALQRQLTDKTENVTSIFDCCHSARMFRDPSIVPKANDHLGFPWKAVAERWDAVRAHGGADLGDANPLAVQVVACGPAQSAYELAESSIGGSHGALTAALVSVLRRGDVAQLSWREVIEIVRPQILDVVPSQRPDILGPQSARLLFSLTEKDVSGVLNIVEADRGVWVERAALFGVALGDSYALVAPGGDPAHPIAKGVIDAVVGDRGRLSFEQPLTSPVGEGVMAYPVEVSLGRRPVAVTPAGHPDRQRVVEAFRNSPTVRVVADAPPTGVLATLVLDDEGVAILDALGEPLADQPRTVTDATMMVLASSLLKLARATHIRELESGAGPASLPNDVKISFSRLNPATKQETLLQVGDHLFVGDLFVVRIENRSAEDRFVSLLDIGLAGAVTILTPSETSGVTLARGEKYTVGENTAHVLEGIKFFWPEGLPAGGPRPETILTIIADSPVDGLTALQQTGVKTRSVARSPSSSIERLIADLSVGTRDVAPQVSAPREKRYRVHRFDFLLHPTTRAAESGLAEAEFEIDARPDPTFQLIVPRSSAPPPHQVSVRLADLTVHSNRSILATKVRVDFLVVTAPTDAAMVPYQARSVFVDRVKSGDRLPYDNLLIYDGPVDRFLDIAVWVSKADEREVELAELLQTELNGREVAGAIATLAALAVAAPTAAVVAGSIGAVATLVRTGARLLSAFAGTSIGVYRTSLLPHERFGAGDPAQRHPGAGAINAQDMSLAYEVVDAAPLQRDS
jgi:hypothetical protein